MIFDALHGVPIFKRSSQFYVGLLVNSLLKFCWKCCWTFSVKSIVQILKAFELHVWSFAMVQSCWKVQLFKVSSLYVAEWRALEKERPEAYHFLKKSGFVVCPSECRNFNCVSTDQTLEQSMNREGKGPYLRMMSTSRKYVKMQTVCKKHRIHGIPL